MAAGLNGGYTMTPTETALLRDAAELPDELATRFQQIAGLAENWNGYGAPPVDSDCITDAIRIIKIGLAMGLPAPGVAPGGDAGIGIEWETEHWELSIDQVPGGHTTYALDKLHPDGATEESDGAIENDDQMRRIIGLLV